MKKMMILIFILTASKIAFATSTIFCTIDNYSVTMEVSLIISDQNEIVNESSVNVSIKNSNPMAFPAYNFVSSNKDLEQVALYDPDTIDLNGTMQPSLDSEGDIVDPSESAITLELTLEKQTNERYSGSFTVIQYLTGENESEDNRTIKGNFDNCSVE